MPPGSAQVAAQRLLGRRLRALRQARGLTQDQVGERAGLTGKYISEIERGLRDLPLSTLRVIVERALSAEIHDVFSDGSSWTGARSSGLRAAERIAEYGGDRFAHGVEATARDISSLPPKKRRLVLGLLRTLLRLAR